VIKENNGWQIKGEIMNCIKKIAKNGRKGPRAKMEILILSGKIAKRKWEPSKGGRGIKLKIAKTRLIQQKQTKK